MSLPFPLPLHIIINETFYLALLLNGSRHAEYQIRAAINLVGRLQYWPLFAE